MLFCGVLLLGCNSPAATAALTISATVIGRPDLLRTARAASMYVIGPSLPQPVLWLLSACPCSEGVLAVPRHRSYGIRPYVRTLSLSCRRREEPEACLA